MEVGDYTVITHVLITFLLFFIQPVFIVGLLYAIYQSNKRVAYTRKTFRVNFNRKKFEIKNYLLKGILPGILLSILFLVIGVPLTLNWYIYYQVVTLLLLLLGGYRFIHPIFTFTLTSILMYGMDRFSLGLPFKQMEQVFSLNHYSIDLTTLDLNALLSNSLLFASVLLFVSTFYLGTKKINELYPILHASKRGKKVASYQKNILSVLPLLIIVPGDVIHSFADWWPLFTLGETEYALLLMPILIGFRFTISTQLFEEAVSHIQKEFKLLAIVGFILFVVSYFIPESGIFSSVALILFGLVVLVRHRRRENRWSFRYGPTNEGLRVIAVRTDSPAERLDLEIGDIILEINDIEMVSSERYNEVLSSNRSYVKMRIRRRDGEIILKETPLYDNDYNNLGLLILDN